jgi:hypothetical protein
MARTFSDSDRSRHGVPSPQAGSPRRRRPDAKQTHPPEAALGRRARPTVGGATRPVVHRVGAGQADDNPRGWRVLAARLREPQVASMLLHC